jgi:hypothetical protein
MAGGVIPTLQFHRRILMRLLTLVLFACLLPSATFAAETVKDIAGWSDTRWGMSVEELSRLHPDFTIGVDKYGLTAGRLSDLTIGGEQFQAYLMFEGAGGLARADGSVPEPPKEKWRLVRVEIRNPKQDACYRVTESLLGKYGQPTKREEGFNLWVLPTTTIRQVSNYTDCAIIYHPTEKSDNL